VTPREPGPRRAGDHGSFEELAVGYALRALEPEDELRFTAHLAGCAACERAVVEHAGTAAELAWSTPAEPPPSVLAGLRAAIADERRDLDPPSSPPVHGALPPVADLGAARRRREVRLPRTLLLSGAAAATAVLLGLGAWNVVLQNDRDVNTDRLAATVEALESREARTVQLADFDGNVKAVVIAHGQQMSLVVDGLEPNREDTVYVLWGQSRSGEVRALSTFDVSTEGLDIVRGMPLQVPVEDLMTIMVTHEQGRTPPDETAQPVLVAGSV
jgi:hypothetical protein